MTLLLLLTGYGGVTEAPPVVPPILPPVPVVGPKILEFVLEYAGPAVEFQTLIEP
jgi:hypothetical protein